MKNYFKKLGIPGPTPAPVFGNIITFFSKGIYRYDTETLLKYNRTCGVFEGTTPSILTSDPKFIKEVMIKESGKFVNRRVGFQLLINLRDSIYLSANFYMTRCLRA